MQKFVRKERETLSFALQEVKQWGIQQLQRGENQMMSKEIINLKLEKI